MNKTSVLSLKLPPDRKAELVEAAAIEGISVNELVWEMWVERRTRAEERGARQTITLDPRVYAPGA